MKVTFSLPKNLLERSRARSAFENWSRARFNQCERAAVVFNNGIRNCRPKTGSRDARPAFSKEAFEDPRLRRFGNTDAAIDHRTNPTLAMPEKSNVYASIGWCELHGVVEQNQNRLFEEIRVPEALGRRQPLTFKNCCFSRARSFAARTASETASSRYISLRSTFREAVSA